MPIAPIDGAYYYPEAHESSALVGFAVGSGLSEGRTPLALEADGPQERPIRIGLGAGEPVEAAARLSLEAGVPSGPIPARLAAELVGEVLVAARRALTVAPDLSTYPTRLGLEVITSRQIRAAAALGLTVNGAAFSRHVRRALTVNPFLSGAVRLSLEVGAAPAEAAARLAFEVESADGFLALADIIGPVFNDSGGQVSGSFYPFTDITARASVAGQDLPVRRFDYSAAPDKLGAVFNVEVARPDLPVALNDDFTLKLVVWDATGDEHEFTLVDEGKVQGRNLTIQWSGSGPGDTLGVSGFDVEADKFGLAPRTSVTVFDPDKVDIRSIETKPRDAIISESGATLLPQLEPVSGLKMLTVLQRAYTGATRSRFVTPLSRRQGTALSRVAPLLAENPYTAGLGFDYVITNIPDYAVSRADFTVEAGWHDGCQPLVGMYGPIFLVEFGTLFVLDTFRALPYGYVARVVPVSGYVSLAVGRQIAEPFNAVLLTYQVRPDEEGPETYIAYRYEQNTEENGEYGALGYQRVETTDKVAEVRRTGDNSLVTSVVEEHRANTYAIVPDPNSGAAGIEMLIHRETQRDFYSEDFKVGHHKVVEGVLYTGPQPSLELQTLLTEDCTVTWSDDPMQPGQKVQARSHTRYEGLVYISTETESRLDPTTGENVDVPKVFPALVAEASGIMADDGTLELRPIRLVTEILRTTKGNQLDVMVTDVDLLKGQVRFSKSDPRVSSGLRSVNKYEVRGQTMMIRDTASEAEIGPRRPQPVNAGELPRDRAIELAHRVLRNGFDPPESVRVDLPGVDFAIRRGSVLRGQYRDGSHTPPFIVRGFTITGNNLGQSGTHRISMNLEGVELR